MDRVLILLATYNGEKYLKEQLDSIFAQEGVRVAVLARDDGSTDRTQDILEEYSGRYDLQWYTGEHMSAKKGFYDLMKHGIGMDYEFYAFSDQDDVWDPDKLKVAVDAIRDGEKPALYYCGQRLVDEHMNFLADHDLNSERRLTARFILSDFAGCTGVFNRKLLKEVTDYEPGHMLMHDTWILKVCLGVGGNVVIDPKPHMNYRQHGGNTLGLERSLSGYLRQVRQYLNVYMVEPQMIELIKGYGDRLVPPYRELATWVCGYRTNREYRKKLLDKRNIDFCAKGLNITYRLKVMLNRL